MAPLFVTYTRAWNRSAFHCDEFHWHHLTSGANTIGAVGSDHCLTSGFMAYEYRASDCGGCILDLDTG